MKNQPPGTRVYAVIFPQSSANNSGCFMLNDDLDVTDLKYGD